VSVIFHHSFNQDQLTRWLAVVFEARVSLFDIWKDQKCASVFREAALMALTAPSASDCYDYRTRDASIKEVYYDGYRCYHTVPDCLKDVWECPKLTEEYAKAILWWLEHAHIPVSLHLNYPRVKY
jgi:hypothetical protein